MQRLNLKVITVSLLLSACATAASYQTDCFQEYPDEFDMAVSCTKNSLNDDFRINLPVNHSFVAALYPYMDLIAQEVKTQKITHIEGQLLIATRINELTNQQIELKQKQQAINALTRPAPAPRTRSIQTNCNSNGPFINCTSN